MSLDMEKTVGQIGSMVEVLKSGEEEWGRHLQTALSTVHESGGDLVSLQHKLSLAADKVTWLVAGVDEPLNARYPAPELPADFSVLATDGSDMDVDRHGSASCYLINIGSVALKYGSQPEATLQSEPRLYADEEDMVLRDPASNQEQMVTGQVLGAKRMVEECRVLRKLVEERGTDEPALALLDGSLILWNLGGRAVPDFVLDALLYRGLLKELGGFEAVSEDKRVALASYISHPRSTDVVNVLRVAICPHESVDCDRHCSSGRDGNKGCETCISNPKGRRECDDVAGVTDRHLFRDLLEPGERSALFLNRSQIMKKYEDGQKIHFFYLNVGDEVARVEVPQWVAQRRDLVDLTHAVCLDQCRKGHGYPVALSEAHEQAVVTGADREEFWRMVDQALGGNGLWQGGSAKSVSKRTRWI